MQFRTETEKRKYMTGNVARELLEPSFVLVLGDSFSSRWLALRISLFCGLPTVICDVRAHRWARMLPFGRFCGIGDVTSADVLELMLEDLSAYSEDGVKFLIPRGEGYKRLVRSKRPALESRYIVTDEARLFSEYFGARCKK